MVTEGVVHGLCISVACVRPKAAEGELRLTEVASRRPNICSTVVLLLLTVKNHVTSVAIRL